MTRSRMIWGKWDCSNCQTKGISAEPHPGEAQPKCPHCGSPREDDAGEIPYLDNKTDADTGRVLDANVADTEAELAIAAGGADWQCKFCRANNRASAQNCISCGALRSELAASMTAQIAAVPPPEEKPRRGYLNKAMLVAGLTVSSCIGVSLWIQGTHEVSAVVASTQWETAATLEKIRPGNKIGVEKDLTPRDAVMPFNGQGEIAGIMNLSKCQPKFHHNERYQCGSDYVCHTRSRQVRDGESCRESCTTTTNRNGSFTESCRDVVLRNTEVRTIKIVGTNRGTCERPINEMSCDYETFDWKEVERKTLNGALSRPQWASLAPAEKQRVRKTGEFKVKLTYDNGNKEFILEPGSEAEFNRWTPGESAWLIVNNAGTVQKALRQDEIEEYRRKP